MIQTTMVGEWVTVYMAPSSGGVMINIQRAENSFTLKSNEAEELAEELMRMAKKARDMEIIEYVKTTQLKPNLGYSENQQEFHRQNGSIEI